MSVDGKAVRHDGDLFTRGTDGEFHVYLSAVGGVEENVFNALGFEPGLAGFHRKYACREAVYLESADVG